MQVHQIFVTDSPKALPDPYCKLGHQVTYLGHSGTLKLSSITMMTQKIKVPIVGGPNLCQMWYLGCSKYPFKIRSLGHIYRSQCFIVGKTVLPCYFKKYYIQLHQIFTRDGSQDAPCTYGQTRSLGHIIRSQWYIKEKTTFP